MSGKQDFLVVGNSCDFKIILDGAGPVICIKGLVGFGKTGRFSVLEVAESRVLSSSAIILLWVQVGNNLLKGSSVGLLGFPSSLAIFHDKTEHLSHVGIRGCWHFGVSTATTSSTGVVGHPEVFYGG